jgi:hypothetical protein
MELESPARLERAGLFFIDIVPICVYIKSLKRINYHEKNIHRIPS